MTNEAAAVCAYDLRRFLLSTVQRYHESSSSGVSPGRKVPARAIFPDFSLLSSPSLFTGASHAAALWTEFAIAIVASDRDCKKQRIYRGCPRFIELFPSYQFYGEFGIDFPATEMWFVVITGRYEIDRAIIRLEKGLLSPCYISLDNISKFSMKSSISKLY